MSRHKTSPSLYTDGGARGNPGPAAIGGVLFSPSHAKVFEFSEYIGSTTNNQAEYRALIHGLKEARERGTKVLACYLDSELVVEQLNFRYKVKDPALARLFAEIHRLRQSFDLLTFSHIPREKNILADKLVNRALDAASK